MPPDLNTPSETQTPDSAPVTVSPPIETLPEPQNAPTEGFTPVPVESPNEPVNTIESNTENTSFLVDEAPAKPVPEPVQASEPSTAQKPVNEPLPEQETGISEPEPKPQISNEQADPVREKSKPSLARELLIKARNAIQFRKRKKLDKVMSLFLKQSKITNDEVEKFLHVSDATATRYLSILKKEGKIKQSGRTGKAVSYSRI